MPFFALKEASERRWVGSFDRKGRIIVRIEPHITADGVEAETAVIVELDCFEASFDVCKENLIVRIMPNDLAGLHVNIDRSNEEVNGLRRVQPHFDEAGLIRLPVRVNERGVGAFLKHREFLDLVEFLHRTFLCEGCDARSLP